MKNPVKEAAEEVENKKEIKYSKLNVISDCIITVASECVRSCFFSLWASPHWSVSCSVRWLLFIGLSAHFYCANKKISFGAYTLCAAWTRSYARNAFAQKVHLSVHIHHFVWFNFKIYKVKVGEYHFFCILYFGLQSSYYKHQFVWHLSPTKRNKEEDEIKLPSIGNCFSFNSMSCACVFEVWLTISINRLCVNGTHWSV